MLLGDANKSEVLTALCAVFDQYGPVHSLRHDLAAGTESASCCVTAYRPC